MIKYREPPLTPEKTYRLITFLHHTLKEIPITANAGGFPLGSVIEDLSLTLSLKPNTQSYSIWIITIQFMLSCLKSTPQNHITTPVILSVIKEVLLEMIRLPEKDMSPIEQKCFSVGKELLDLFFIRKEDGLVQSVGYGIISYYDVIYSVSYIEK